MTFVEEVLHFLEEHDQWNQNRMAVHCDVSRAHMWYCLRGERPISGRLQERIQTAMNTTTQQEDIFATD